MQHCFHSGDLWLKHYVFAASGLQVEFVWAYIGTLKLWRDINPRFKKQSTQNFEHTGEH